MIIYFVSPVENEYDARRYLVEDLQEPYLCLPLQIEVFVWMLQTFDLRKIHEQVAAATYDYVLVTAQKNLHGYAIVRKGIQFPHAAHIKVFAE